MPRPDRRLGPAIAALALAAALAPAPGDEPDPDVALAREQLKVIDLAFKDMDAMIGGGQLSRTDPQFSAWGRRKLDALRTSKAGKDEMVAALTDYARRMKETEEYTAAAHRAGRATRLDIRDAQFRRLEAELWLNQEKAR